MTHLEHPARRCLARALGARVRRHGPLMLWLLVGLALSGCALKPPATGTSGSVVAGAQQGRALDANLNGFLSQSAGGAVIQLARSPWGPDVEVFAGPSYFAASGRACRELTIRRSAGQVVRHAVACETAQGGWVSQRLVTEALTHNAQTMEGGRR